MAAKRQGWGCSSVGIASDRHAADAGSTPRWARDFSPRVTFQCRLSYGVRTPPCAIACIYICAQVKDPVVHVKSSVDYWNTKTPSMHPRLGSATLSQLAFPGEGNPNFRWEKSHWHNTVVKKKVKKKKTAVAYGPDTGTDPKKRPRWIKLSELAALIEWQHQESGPSRGLSPFYSDQHEGELRPVDVLYPGKV